MNYDLFSQSRYYRFTLDQLSRFYVILLSICHMAVSWPLDQVQVSVRMLPVRLALCDLEAPGWGGALVSALCLCCFMAHITVWHFCGFVVSAFVFLCHTLG